MFGSTGFRLIAGMELRRELAPPRRPNYADGMGAAVAFDGFEVGGRLARFSVTGNRFYNLRGPAVRGRPAMAGYVESGNIEDDQPVRPAGTFTLEATIRHSDLREDGRKVLLSLQSNARAKLREIVLSGAGTDFRGGDRNLVITDGASVWTVIPAARLKNLAASR